MRSGAVDEGLDLDGLAAQLDTEQGVDEEYLRSTGMPQELAAKTGLDVDTAIKALQKVLAMLVGRRSRKRPKSLPKRNPEAPARRPNKARQRSLRARHRNPRARQRNQ